MTGMAWRSGRTGRTGDPLFRIPFMLLFFVWTASASAQPGGSDSLMIFRFTKGEAELPEPGTWFNVLEIANNGDDPLTGVLHIDGPDGWHFIGSSPDSLTLSPGSSMLIPVRVSIPRNTQGGISFVIAAEFISPDLYNYTNAYLSIRKVTGWDMYLPETEIYLSDFRPEGEVSVQLVNSGNSDELIKLSFDMGGLLKFREAPEADSFLFVDVPAHADTTITLDIGRKQDLTYAVEQALNRNWRARSLYIRASTPEIQRTGSVRATTLESERLSRISMLNTPFNVEVFMHNLLSRQPKKASLKAFGRVLFPDEQQLDYSVGYYNLYFDPEMNRNSDLLKQLRYMIRYRDPRSDVLIGDRLGVGMLHTLSGRGARLHHDLENGNRIMLHVIQNPFARNIGGFAGYQGNLQGVTWNSGLTAETSTNGQYSHFSIPLGASFKLRQRHHLDLQTATSLSRYGVSTHLDHDTTLMGFSYRATYRYRGERLHLNAQNTNTLLSYMRNSGINRSFFTGDYRFTNQFLMKGRYYRTRYASTKYPFNFAYPASINVNENARLLLSYNTGGIIYQGGPQYVGTVRNQYFPFGDYSSRYVNFQPGVIGMVTFKLGGMRSITPNGSFNAMFYDYDTYDNEGEGNRLQQNWTYTVGLNYYDQAFKLNAYYSTGNATDIYRTAVIGGDQELNQSIHIRPYYERYFLRDAIWLTAFVNYSYYMPSQRENLLLNLTGHFRLKSSWSIFVSANGYRVSRVDLNTGRVTTRDVNMMLGVRKSFDIQQPRLAFHDLTIVGFNDLDGDGIRDDNEKPISDVLVNISRDEELNEIRNTGFAEISMITDPNGLIYYEKIPEGYYDLSIIPLTNLQDLYFLEGERQTIEVTGDMVYYLPLVESYKIRGRILIDRDPNSNEGIISPEGIRVTAVAENGEVFSTLSDGFGSYVLDLPRANSYEVSIYNVFGEQFRLERGTYRVQFTENRTIHIDFRFTERRREIRFNEEEQYFRFNLENGGNQSP